MRKAFRSHQVSIRTIIASQAPLKATPHSFHQRKMATNAPSHASVLKQPLKLACVQLASGSDKTANLTNARAKVQEAAAAGAKLVVLPECFNSPYGCDHFPSYAEPLPPLPSSSASTTKQPTPGSREKSPSYYALSDMAKEAGVFLIGGSIPELVEADSAKKQYYNTSLVFSPTGALLATHRKAHLFDIDIPGKVTFRESDVLSAGNKVTIIDLPDYGRVGLAICYDIRFPELATIAARRGCFALVYPGAFNLTTGPLHWKLQGQARAMDNQVYVALCSPARDLSAGYPAYGHSMVIDPMAQVVTETEEAESIVYAELDGAKIEETMRNIPLRDQRRFDIYPDLNAGRIRFDDPGQI